MVSPSITRSTARTPSQIIGSIRLPLSDKRLSKSAIRHQIYFSRQIPDQLTLPSLPCSLIHQNSCSHSCIQGLHLAAHGDPDETIGSFCCLFRQPVSFISNKKCCAALIIFLIIGIFPFRWAAKVRIPFCSSSAFNDTTSSTYRKGIL